MKRNRRSFLKAALGCSVAALGVPGALLLRKPKLKLLRPTARENLCSWYKPGIWALPKATMDTSQGTIDVRLLDGSLIVFEDDGVVHLKFENGQWKEDPSSKRS